jgi:hypothetical protein
MPIPEALGIHSYCREDEKSHTVLSTTMILLTVNSSVVLRARSSRYFDAFSFFSVILISVPGYPHDIRLPEIVLNLL